MSGGVTVIQDHTIQESVGPVVMPGEAPVESKERNNGIKLASGNHEAVRTTKPATTITAAPEAVVKNKPTAGSSSVIYGATYECSGDEPAVVVEPAGRLVLVACHFTKSANTQSATGSYIKVNAGGALTVIGCYFHNAQGAGFAIDNASALASVQAIGCIRETTAAAPHNNVTPIGEVVL